MTFPVPAGVLAGRRVVVTGGGDGIGAALARRCAAAGAAVVINDIDPDQAETIAAQIGGLAVAGDVADEAFVRHLVATARDALGGIDIFFANAGIAPVGSMDADDALWQAGWEVNVMSHVYAARALVPQWVASGTGRLVATVSAAGLLTMLGSAPYSVTKHAALGFAEWLRATYEHRGVVVQALCPQGVTTALLDRAGPAGRLLLGDTAISPEELAEHVLKALQSNDFLILPHPEVAEFYRRRATDPNRWLSGMNRVQQHLDKVLESS